MSVKKRYVDKAVEVFLSTGTRFPRSIIWAMGLIKYSAAKANSRLGLLNNEVAEAIMKASMELADGEHDDKMLVDVYQTGSGTGINMNVNEVIAARASEILGKPVHPNDHVNMAQSSNDVVPTAIRIAALVEIKRGLLPALEEFIDSLRGLAERTSDVVKPGRTHLRDALPVTMGQEFNAYVDAFTHDKGLVEGAMGYVGEVPIGGTAVGTGANAHPRFPGLVVEELRALTGLPLEAAKNRFRAMRLLTDMVALSSALKALALDLYRLSQDVRLMFSGPFTAIGEIDIPQEVAGSSIMPGKSNPVTVEASMLAASQVMGLDYSNTIAGLLGEFELSMAVPLIGYNLVTQVRLMTEALRKTSTHVLNKITPNRGRCMELAEKSPALITVISPVIGYDRATLVAKRVMEGLSVREALKREGFSDDEINKILDLSKLVKPGLALGKQSPQA